MYNMPQRPPSHIIGDRAILELKKILPKRWLCREIKPDYGIDVEIEIVLDNGTVTGAILKGQVKGSESEIKVRKYGISVSVTSVRYWVNLPVPVVLVRVTSNPYKVLWLPVRDYLLKKELLDSIFTTSKKTIFFNFKNSLSLPENVEEMEKLGLNYQAKVFHMLQEEEEMLKADFMGYIILVQLFDGDPDALIKYLREKGSLNQLKSDLSFAIWVKEQSEQDPTFLDRVCKMVKEFIKSVNE